MNPIRKLFAVCLGLSLVLSSCGPSGPGPSAWLDRPLDQTRHPLEPLEIIAHASSASGVAAFSFRIDGEVVHQAEVSGTRMEMTKYTWTPAEPGVYQVGVEAKDSSGLVGNLATSTIYIGGAEDPRRANLIGDCDGIEYAEITANPSSLAPGECSQVFWEVVAPPEWTAVLNGKAVEHVGEMPLCLQESAVVELNIETEKGICQIWKHINVDEKVLQERGSIPDLNVVFEANPPEIHQGECSTLFWEVIPPEGGETLLQSQPVPPAGEQEVCPLETSFYELIAVRNEIGQSIFLAVTVLEDGPLAAEIPEITLTPEIGITLASPPTGQPTATYKPSGGPTSTPPSVPTNTPAAPGPSPTAAPDTSPPLIQSASVSPNDYVYTSDGSCSPTAFKFSVKATDSGGIASVVLNWTGSGVRSGPLTMNYSGGKYVRTLDQFNNPGSMSNFSITATDKAGNQSTLSPGWHLGVEQCGGGS